MKKTRLLSLVLAFMLMLSSVGVFAEEKTQEPTQEPVQTTYQLSAEAIALRDNIANVLKDVEDGWSAMDMAAYSKLPDAIHTMSDATKQKIINAYIDEAAGNTATASDRARIEIVLRALGADSTQLYTINNNTQINNAQILNAADHTALGHYGAPWILLADLQGNVNLSQTQTTALIDVLSANSANGTFGYEWEGVTYSDPDTAAAALAALAPVYNTNDDAKALADTILSALDTMIAENGSFGSANSDAMVIIGLVALGKNPAELRHSITKKSVIDGLLSYTNEAGNGFTFSDTENYLATEQGFRALVALSAFNGEAYNIYDFSDTEVLPARQQNAEDTTPVVPDDGAGSITVSITIKSDSEYWVDALRLSIPESGTVYDAFVGALSSKNDMSAIGAEKGYVRSITKGNVTLSEFDKGSNSGWLYKVNDTKPSVGLTDYVLSSGDEIVWYYTEDWKKDTTPTFSGGGPGGFGGGSYKPKDEPEEEPKEEPEKSEETIVVPEFSDVENHWSKEAVEYVAQKGIMNGVTEGEFAPDKKLTRGMLVTMLYRLSGDTAEGKNEFLDITDGAWYADAAIWASANGISGGYGNGKFGADDDVTREQLVVMLMRYAALKGIDTTAEKTEFKDNDKISDWAQDSVYWAKSYGLVLGRGDGTFAPDSGATRGEIAAVFMRFCENVLK